MRVSGKKRRIPLHKKNITPTFAFAFEKMTS